MSLVDLVIDLVVVGLVLYIISLLPIDAGVKRIIHIRRSCRHLPVAPSGIWYLARSADRAIAMMTVAITTVATARISS